MFVQFKDETKSEVVATFASPQDAAYYPYQAEVDRDDPRYVLFAELFGAIKDGGGSAITERAWRDSEITRWAWFRDRHRDQLELGVDTTLTVEQFAELLVYLQALRDWPQSEAFPESSARPVPPLFLEQLGVEL